MSLGASLFLIAVGAILRFAVTADLAGIDIQTVGTILMVIGVVGFAISLWLYLAAQAAGRLPAAPALDHGERRGLLDGSALRRPRSLKPTTIEKTPRKSIVTAKNTASVTRPMSGQARMTMPTIASSAPSATPHQRVPGPERAHDPDHARGDQVDADARSRSRAGSRPAGGCRSGRRSARSRRGSR